MTSDIRSLINKCTSTFTRREARNRLKREVARHKTSVGCKREMNYIRGLGSSIKTIHRSILWLRFIRASGVKIERLETRLKKRRAKLVSETKAVESGWLDAWREQVRSNQTSRFYWLGVTAYRNNYNLTRICRNASYFILRDNWGSKQTLAINRIPVEEPNAALAQGTSETLQGCEVQDLASPLHIQSSSP